MKVFGVLFAIVALVFAVVCGMSTGANPAGLKEIGKSAHMHGGPPGGGPGGPPPGSPPGPPPMDGGSSNSTS